MITCMGTQSLSCSLLGLGEPVDCGVSTCGGLWTTNTPLQCQEMDQQQCKDYISSTTNKNGESENVLWKTNFLWAQNKHHNCANIFCTTLCRPHLQTPKQNKKVPQHHHLSLLLSHSSCASRRILSSSPCRVEEMLSCGPVRLSLRLTAAISSSSSTQEPEEETTQAAEFIAFLSILWCFRL